MLSVLGLLLVAGCGDCVLIGCHSGIRFEVANLPAAPFRVELVEGGATTRVVLCGERTPGEPGGSCFGNRIEFHDVFPAAGRLRVVTPDGAAREVAFTARYRDEYPNGKGCPGRCSVADVSVRLP